MHSLHKFYFSYLYSNTFENALLGWLQSCLTTTIKDKFRSATNALYKAQLWWKRLYCYYHEGDCDYHDTETTVILIKFVRNQVGWLIYVTYFHCSLNRNWRFWLKVKSLQHHFSRVCLRNHVIFICWLAIASHAHQISSQQVVPTFDIRSFAMITLIFIMVS
jgi:hypothetical protein